MAADAACSLIHEVYGSNDLSMTHQIIDTMKRRDAKGQGILHPPCLQISNL